MLDPLMLLTDLVAVGVLVLGLYHRRHHRRDLVTAFTVINVGMFAVAAVLSAVDVGLGMGLGIFGVLSIIRLRSSEISQHEVAYYFAALALGLITGLGALSQLLTVTLVAVVLAVVAVIDSPLVLARSRSQVLRLDGADLDEAALARRLEPMLGGRVVELRVLRVDCVDDTVTVDVHWRAGASDGSTTAHTTIAPRTTSTGAASALPR